MCSNIFPSITLIVTHMLSREEPEKTSVVICRSLTTMMYNATACPLKEEKDEDGSFQRGVKPGSRWSMSQIPERCTESHTLDSWVKSIRSITEAAFLCFQCQEQPPRSHWCEAAFMHIKTSTVAQRFHKSFKGQLSSHVLIQIWSVYISDFGSRRLEGCRINV